MSAILDHVMDLIAQLHSAAADRYAIEREFGGAGWRPSSLPGTCGTSGTWARG